LVGSRPVALRSSRPRTGGACSIRGDPGQTVDCPACGEANPGRARFCLACGEPLPTAGRPGGTRKAVTVLFSDLSGSTRLGERLDPESLSRVMARYYDTMRAVVRHHGGMVEKFAGDAVMAVFGVPAAHEDDALRAVRAAADMHAALGELNRGLWEEWRVRLELHTGVNTGEVVAGDPGLGGALVVGDAVNLAARLEQAAGPGQILLGRGTWSLVRDAVEVEPPRVLALPGRRAGEPAYRLLAVRPGAAGRSRRHDAPFVGRASELQLFGWAYQRAVGEPALHLLTVLGGAGVGKTRLVLEAAGRLPDRPAVLVGRCLPYGTGNTFWPLAEVVRQAAGIGLEDPPAAARAKLAALADRGTPDGALAAGRIGQLIGLEAAPAPIEEAVWSTRRLLEALAVERPLVVVFDDLHWAEPTFLDLLEQLAEGTGEAPVLLVAVARPELLEQRPAWAGGRPNAVSMLLEPLGPDDSGALLEGLAGGDPLPEAARDRITRAAGGNPLFIEELLATLVEEGRLRRQDGAWVVAGDLAASGTPPTIQALVAARLDRLDGRDRDVLERAAVVGQAFEQATVAELSPPGSREELPERLGGLVRREFLRTAPARVGAEAGYQFRHLLVRDAVYAAVPKGVRAELHERLAGLLEARAGARVREYEEIVGYHLEQARRCLAELGPLDRRGRELGARAAARLAAAGRRALARGDTPAATALLERALAVAPGDDPVRGHLLNDLAESLVAAGDFGRAGEVLTAATAAAEAGPGGDGLAAQVTVGRLGMRLLTEPGLPLDDLEGEVSAAIAALGRAGDDRGLARAWRLLGYESFMRCQIQRAEEALARTIEHARRAADERVDAYARGMLAAAAFWGPLPVDSGEERCRALLAEAAGNRYVEGSVLHVLGALAAMQGRFDQARALVDQGAEVAATLGRLRLAAIWSQFAATVETLAGRPEAAAERLRRGDRTLERMGETGARSNLAADLAHALVAVGRPEEAGRYADLSRSLAAREDVYAQVRWRSATARALAAGGDPGPAAELAEAAVALAEGTDMLNLQADALLDLAATAEAGGRSEEAAAAAARGLALYERKGNRVAAAAVRSRLGLAAPPEAGGRSAG
jgi:class 3 adenylate cyclase/tetratricopeptide (TPR) repeat protein